MKYFLSIVVVFLLLALCQNSYAQTTWEKLGLNDTIRVSAIENALFRFFGIERAEECLTQFYGAFTDIEMLAIRAKYRAAICVLVGANVTEIPECQYSPGGNLVTDVSQLVTALTSSHQSLGINEAQWIQWRFYFASFLAFFSDSATSNEITANLDAVHDAIVTSGTGSCAVAASVIDWAVPVSFTQTYTSPSVVCFKWNDDSSHSVNVASGSDPISFHGFGTGDGSNTISIGISGTDRLCSSIPDPSVPCYFTAGQMNVCHFFDASGTYRFVCGIHASMTAAITIDLPQTSTDTSATGSATQTQTQTTAAADGGSAASTLTSFVSYF